MAFQQIVAPNMGARDYAGWCHRHTRAVFGAPLVEGLNSATKAANATTFRHHTREMPDVAVPVWFDHDGDYDGTGVKNWGHVVAWVPGVGFLSSPGHPKLDAAGREVPSQQWFSSIEAIERTFNARFRFWSEDINGLRVAEPSTSTPDGQEEDEEMAEEYKGFIHTEGGVGSKQIVIIGHRPSGYKFVYTAEAKTGRHPTHEKYAAVFNTGDYISVPRDELDAWERSLDEQRQGK